MNADYDPYTSTKKVNDFLAINDISVEVPVIT
jgi:hypothetical protein